jgi:hypothetical protein
VPGATLGGGTSHARLSRMAGKIPGVVHELLG